MQTFTAVGAQPPPSPAPSERPPISGWGVVLALVALAVTLVIVTKTINSMFGGGSDKKSGGGGWR